MIKELEALAKAAIPLWDDAGHDEFVSEPYKYIAAANPAAILELIATMKMMGEALEFTDKFAPALVAGKAHYALTAYRKLMGEE